MAITTRELAERVRAMRKAQASYFSERRSDLLAAAVRLEKEVDQWVARVLDGDGSGNGSAATQGEQIAKQG